MTHAMRHPSERLTVSETIGNAYNAEPRDGTGPICQTFTDVRLARLYVRLANHYDLPHWRIMRSVARAGEKLR